MRIIDIVRSIFEKNSITSSQISEVDNILEEKYMVDLIDLESFFNDDDKNAKYKDNVGTGAFGIITPHQMILRLNNPRVDEITCKSIAGLGPHEEINKEIKTEIFDLPEEYITNSNVFFKLPDLKKRQVSDNLFIRMVNDIQGNSVNIEVPYGRKNISSKELRAVQLLGRQVEIVSKKINKPIYFNTYINGKDAGDENTEPKNVISLLNEYVDDSREESTLYEKVIAKTSIDEAYKLLDEELRQETK